MITALLSAVAVMVWWAFFSRAPRFDRWAGLVLMLVALVATSRLVHVSIRTGAMGMLFFVSAAPVLSLALVVWAAASRRLPDGARRASMVAVVVLVCGFWTILRTEGVTSDLIGSDFHWRWTPTAEQRLLSSAAAPAPHPISST